MSVVKWLIAMGIVGLLSPLQSGAQVRDKKLAVLASVSSSTGGFMWAKQSCQAIYGAVQSVAARPTEVGCLWNQKDHFIDTKTREALNSGTYSLYLELRQSAENEFTLRAVNRDREVDEEYLQVEWQIHSAQKLEQNIAKLIQSVIAYHENKHTVLTNLVALAAGRSNEIDLDKDGNFVERMTKMNVSGRSAYLNFVHESPQQKHYVRTAIELAVSLGFGQYGYLLNKERMARDWDFPTVRDSVRGKLNGEAFRFDDNSFFVNRDHAFAGVAYYTIARNNGFSSYESFLITLASSSVWEFVVEYREVVSLNDQVITPIGGLVIGEALFQLQKIFDRPGNSLVKKSLGYVFQSPRNFHRLVDKYTRPEDKFAAALQESGFNRDIWSKFELFAGSSTNTAAASGVRDTTLGMNAQVINIPVYEEAGQKREFLVDTAFSQLVFEKSTGAVEPSQFYLMARVALAAYYEKNLGRDLDGHLEGYNFWIGPASRVKFKHSENKNHEELDQQAVVNVLGTMMQMSFYKNGFKVTANFEVYGDFAMMRAYNIEKYKAEQGEALLPGVLARNDYYYGLGYTTNGHIVVEYGKWSLEAGSSYQTTTAINKRYRYGNEGESMPEIRDSEIVLDASIAYKLAKNLEIKFRIERSKRAGFVEGAGTREETQTRRQLYLTYFF